MEHCLERSLNCRARLAAVLFVSLGSVFTWQRLDYISGREGVPKVQLQIVSNKSAGLGDVESVVSERAQREESELKSKHLEDRSFRTETGWSKDTLFRTATDAPDGQVASRDPTDVPGSFEAVETTTTLSTGRLSTSTTESISVEAKPVTVQASNVTSTTESSSLEAKVVNPQATNENDKHMSAADRLLTPGRCGATFLEPPCDPFKLIDADLAKWEDGSVLLKFVKNRYGKSKRILLGTIGRKLYAIYTNKDELRSTGDAQRVASILYDLLQQVELDIEFVASFGDVPQTESHNGKCSGHDFTFHTVSSPAICDVSLPVTIRPSLIDVKDPVQYAKKRNQGFWRGSLWPADRCGGLKDSPRFLMCKASKDNPTVINASVSSAKIDGREPGKELQELVGPRVAFEEHYKYRFLLASAPRCTYTGRILQFLLTNSVLVKFGSGYEFAAQPVHAGLQDGVHAKFLHRGGKGDRHTQWFRTLQDLEKHWELFEQLPRNANAYLSWLSSPQGVQCYMFELLLGYRRKLAYKPSTSRGVIASFLDKLRVRPAKPDVLTADGPWGSRVKSYTAYHHVVEVAELPPWKLRDDGITRLQRSCEAFKQQRPKEKVWDRDTQAWRERTV